MRRDVVIVGGGIGGLTAALALSSGGHRVTVHERAPDIGEVGAGLQLSANAMAVLARLGIAQDVIAAATLPEAVELCDGVTGRALARVPLGPAARARWGHPHCVIHRADLIAILLAAARRAGARIVTGSTVVADDLPKADVIVAADGLRSGFRALMGAGGAVRFTGHVAWRALVPCDPDTPPITRNHMAPGRHVITYPLRAGARRVMNIAGFEETSLVAQEGWRQEADPAQMRARFGGMADAVSHWLARVETCHKWGLFAHAPLPDWRHGNIALLGDAAHPMLPYLAQGAGMAIEDALALSRCLSGGGTVAEALTAYQAARQDRADAVVAASAAAGGIYHHRGPLRWARNQVLGVMGRVAPARLVRRMDWIYGGGPGQRDLV